MVCKANIQKALEAFQSVGISISHAEIAPDGTVRLSTGSVELPVVTDDPFAQWESRRD